MEDLLTAFRWRLAETIAWCDALGSLADPVNSLRTPSLEPACMMDEPNHTQVPLGYPWGDAPEKQATLRALSEARFDRLYRTGLHPVTPATNVGNGRLLISDHENSDWCCLSVHASRGFIDSDDVPPWDTWLWYGEEPAAGEPGFLQRMQTHYREYSNQIYTIKRHWLCWIPTAFIPLVNEGIAVNPVECFWWASEYKERGYDTPFLRLLDVEGFLR